MWIDSDSLSMQQKRKIEYILKEKVMSKIKVKLLNENCMPERTHRWDAGWDLKAVDTVVIPAGQTVKIHTGVIFEIPPRYFGMVVPRSGLGTKFNVTLANDVGIIDSEYRGEVLVFLNNASDFDYKLTAGDRFAQIIIVPVNTAELWAVDQVSETGRGSGGFGSTTESQVKEASIDELKLWGENEVPMDEVSFVDIKTLKPTEYLELQKTGKLLEIYPEATGNIKEDLGL